MEWKAELKGKWDMEIETEAATFCFLIENEKGVYPVCRGYMGCSQKLGPFWVHIILRHLIFRGTQIRPLFW